MKAVYYICRFITNNGNYCTVGKIIHFCEFNYVKFRIFSTMSILNIMA